ncbi:MAG: zf-HC2 domain-containing protein [Candidatus Binatia bacterium]
MTSEICESVILDLPAYARGLLPPSAASPVERHLRSCPGCQAELGELERLEQVLIDHLPTIAPSVSFASTFASRLAAEVLADEERSAAPGFFGWLLRPWVIPLAVAATLGAVVFSSSLLTAPGPVAPVARLERDAAPPPVAEARPAARTEVAGIPSTDSPKGSGTRRMFAAPPRDLLERADLFVDYSVIQNLDVLESSERAG